MKNAMSNSREYRLLSDVENGYEVDEDRESRVLVADIQQQEADEIPTSTSIENGITERSHIISIHIPWSSVLCVIMILAIANASTIFVQRYFDKEFIYPSLYENPTTRTPVEMQDVINDDEDLRHQFKTLFPECVTRHPLQIFDHWCDLEHNSAECGYDNGACQEYNEKYKDRCDVKYPSLLGNGVCDEEGGYNTEDCDWDGGDCLKLQ